jgi:hypothetical protein
MPMLAVAALLIGGDSNATIVAGGSVSTTHRTVRGDRSSDVEMVAHTFSV